MRLRNIELFSSLSDSEILELEKISFEKKFSDKDIIFMEGDNSEYLYLLLEGTVDMVKCGAKFGEFHLHYIEAPSMIAELPTSERFPFPASAKAVGDVKVIKINFNEFTKMLAKPEISYAFIKSLLQKMKILEGFIQKELNLDAHEKVIALLSENPSIFATTKHIEIAKMLNITPETLSRALKKLKNTEVIEGDGKSVRLRED